ncbi:hypothetical protein C6341_g26137, partial [Phytophthora cactorum]
MLSAGLGSQATTATSVAMAHQVQAQQAQVQAQVQAAQAAQVASQVAAASSGSPALAAKPKRRRRADGSGNLTVEQKRRICEKHRNTPKITQKDLCRWAKLEFNLQRAPTQPTMSNILKHEHMFKDNVLGVLGSQRKTIRPTRHAHFDQVLANWVMERQNKGNITGDMIKSKGRELVKQMGLEGKLGFSNGWLASFKARHGLMKRTNNMQNDKSSTSSGSAGKDDPKENDEEFRVPNAAP